VIVVVAPGQGSQTPGFLSPWLELPGVSETLDQLSDASQVDLIRHGTLSDEGTIRDTNIAQPLIVAASILTWGEISKNASKSPAAVAGHSVGEFAAAAVSGVLYAVDALRLVGVRGRAMAEEAGRIQTGMSAVLGGELEAIQDRLTELGLHAANMNGGGQVVVAGELKALAQLAESPIEGTRVIPLQVAGAFHTHFMQGAVEKLKTAATNVTVHDPKFSIFTNKDGSRVDTGDEYLDLMVGQVSNPVRWDLCMESFEKAGVTGIIELAPAGALVGLAKRALRGVPSVAIKSPDDLASAIAMLEA
jgi:[acyl-carrier-protein] S-malonyltransferase